MAEEPRASLSIMCRLAVSVKLGIELSIYVTLWDVVLCGVVKDFAEQGLTRAAGGR